MKLKAVIQHIGYNNSQQKNYITKMEMVIVAFISYSEIEKLIEIQKKGAPGTIVHIEFDDAAGET